MCTTRPLTSRNGREGLTRVSSHVQLSPAVHGCPGRIRGEIPWLLMRPLPRFLAPPPLVRCGGGVFLTHDALGVDPQQDGDASEIAEIPTQDLDQLGVSGYRPSVVRCAVLQPSPLSGLAAVGPSVLCAARSCPPASNQCRQVRPSAELSGNGRHCGECAAPALGSPRRLAEAERAFALSGLQLVVRCGCP